MSETNRREMIAALAALATLGPAAIAQENKSTLGPARVLALSSTPPSKNPNGSLRRQLLSGTLVTGETVSLHESEVPAGTPPAPAHRIAHTEFLFLLEGTLEFEHDGEKSTATAGDTLYIAYGTNHAVRNAGSGMARYQVLSISGDTK